MLKTLLLASASVIALSSFAQAGDLPSKSKAPEAMSARGNPFDGFYVGIHGGYASSKTSSDGFGYFDCEGGCGIGGGLYSTSSTQDGALLGAQAGVNIVNSNGLLFGAEVSGSWANVTGEEAIPFDVEGSIHYSNTFDAIGLVQGKVGYATDTFAVYALGGLALAHSNTSVSIGYDPIPSVYIPIVEDSYSSYHTGWTVGAGAEFMMTKSVSLAMTYNYIDLGKAENNIAGSGIALGAGVYGYGASINTDATMQVGKVNLNFHF